nr:60S ribosomal protein L28-like [Peromyscus maniculatus bairdii]
MDPAGHMEVDVYLQTFCLDEAHLRKGNKKSEGSLSSATLSVHLHWVVFGTAQTYSTEPSNLNARKSFCYNGLVHRKTVEAEPQAEGKGVMAVMRSVKTSHFCTGHPQQHQKMIRKYKYCPGLRMAVICRASAILPSQKPVVVKRKWTRLTKSS